MENNKNAMEQNPAMEQTPAAVPAEQGKYTVAGTRKALEEHITNVNAILASGVLDGLESAIEHMKAEAKAVRKTYAAAAIADLCKMSPADVVKSFMACQTYDFPAVGMDDNGKYKIADSSATLNFEAIENAYWDANKVHLTAKGDYAKYMSIVAFNCMRTLAEKTDKTIALPHLDAAAADKLKELVKENKVWSACSFNALEQQFAILCSAILPDGYTLEKSLRNSDRKWFARSVTKQDTKKRRYVTPNNSTLYATLFACMQSAADGYIYPIDSQTSGVISGVKA